MINGKESNTNDGYSISEYRYEKYIPTLFRPWKACFQDLYFKRRIRFILQALRGSVQYYMYKGNELYGYIWLETGKGTNRYPWAGKDDWVISPYVVKEDFRGQGIGTRMLIDLRECIAPNLSGSIYAEVNVNNKASIKAMETAGYLFLCHAQNEGGLMRHYRIEDKPSEYLVYKMQ